MGGLFGRLPTAYPTGFSPYSTPPIYGGPYEGQAPEPQAPSAPKRKGLFGGQGPGGFGEKLATIGALLAGDPNAVSEYYGQQRQTLAQQALQKAQDETWYQHEQWQRDHPMPRQPGEYESALIASGIQPGTPAWAQHMGNRASGLENPVVPVATVDGNGNPAYTWVPRNPPAAVANGPPQAAVEHLRQHPELRDAFEQKYGPGSASQYLGGAATAGAPPFGASRSHLDAITMMAESGGNPNAVSPAGARGRMQVMPSTARDPGFGIRPSNGTPADDERVGREYRAAMQKRYGGNPAQMWAAYNAGPGRVDHALANYGGDWLGHLPAETQKYVARTTRALRGN